MVSRASRCILAVVCGVLTSACDEPPTSQVPGAELVQAATIDRTITLDLTPVWRIGESPQSGAEFYLVRGAIHLDDGSTLVLDAGNHRVARISASGDLVGSFGREGDGPGELRSPFNLIARFDTLLMTDRGNLVHVFTQDGESVATHRLSFDSDEVNALGSVVASADGWYVTADGYFSNEEGTPPRMRSQLYAFDPASGSTGPAGLWWEHRSEGRWSGMFWVTPPFHHVPSGAFDGLGRWIVADSPDYQFDTYLPDGTLLRRVRADIPRAPVTDELLDDWKASRGCEPGLECSGQAAQVALSMEIPSVRPAIGGLRAFPSGHVAILRSDLDPEPFDGARLREYDYFDPSGVFVAASTGITPLWFDGARLVALEVDGLGVESIVLYEVGVAQPN